jgi:hypothetical protein
MKVHAVFSVTGDSEGNPVHDLIAIAETAYAASKIIWDQLEDADFERDLVHESMNVENSFTFFGARDKTKRSCRWGTFGGYVVEMLEVRP